MICKIFKIKDSHYENYKKIFLSFQLCASGKNVSIHCHSETKLVKILIILISISAVPIE